MRMKKLALGVALALYMAALWNGMAMEGKALDANAEGTSEKENSQTAIWESAKIESDVFRVSKLTDADTGSFSKATGGGCVTVSREDGIGFLYIKFDRVPQPWTMTDNATGREYACGQNGFLHEYVPVEGLPNALTLHFDTGTVIADIYVFSEGQVPDWVQTWENPCEKADLLLISSHSDDEQLFFAGVLPYYAGELGYEVQVAYVVQHFEVGKSQNHVRPHEQLDGLWTVGVRHYPVMGEFPDLYAESKDRQEAFLQAQAVFENYGYTYDDFVTYMVELLRRFKPLVVVSHDLNGEYGHGTHVLASAAITEALEAAADSKAFPESVQIYGVHAVEKLYLHLYNQNKIVMNWDEPLENFGGKTAFEVTREGFDCHKSQHWTWFYKWIYGKEGRVVNKASDIKSYSPCKYGLYYTSVGPDEEGGDFFEHVMTYAEREQHMKEIRKTMQSMVYEKMKDAIGLAAESAAREAGK